MSTDARATLDGLGLPLPAREFCVGVVGSKLPTARGMVAARRVGERLSKAGDTVVTNGGMGVEATAITAALDTLGWPAGVVYPSPDRAAAVVVAVHGLHAAPFPRTVEPLLHRLHGAGLTMPLGTMVSAYPDLEPASRENSLAAAKLLVQLVREVIVVQARDRSTSGVIADEAVAAGVPLFAVPGSALTDRLLREGRATLYRLG